MVVINGLTPHGGDYTEVWYLDDNENVVDKNSASVCMIRECKSDGTLVSSTRGFVNNGH